MAHTYGSWNVDGGWDDPGFCTQSSSNQTSAYDLPSTAAVASGACWSVVVGCATSCVLSMEEVDELVPHPDKNGALNLTHRAWVLLDSVIWTM